MKRACDVIISILLIITLSPMLLFIALAVKLDSPGPVLFRAERAGKGLQLFKMYKFRTMVVNAAASGPAITRGGDSRVTRLGGFLRRYKLDELPQLFNVLKGEMSLVGPRPEDMRYAVRYTRSQRRILTVRPGMASPASLKYCNEEEVLAAIGGDLDEAYLNVVLPDKLGIDLAYVDNPSMLLDLGVLAGVGFAVLPHPHVPKPGITTSRTLDLLFPPYAQWLVVDGSIGLAALGLAWATRFITFDRLILPDTSGVLYFCVAASLFAGMNCRFGLHKRMWQYASASEVFPIAGAVLLSVSCLLLLDSPWPGERPVPLSLPPIAGFYAFAGFVAIRYRRRLLTGLQWRLRALQGDFPTQRSRTIIVGAGEAGQLLGWRFQSQQEGKRYQLVGYVDDDPRKQGMLVHGFPILGNRDSIPELVARNDVDLIILAMRNLSAEQFQAVLDICERTPAAIKVLPSIFDFFDGAKGVFPIRDICPDDLMGRKAVCIDKEACARLVTGKAVLVTGAAGSIGSELCRQIALFGPSHLIIADNNESGVHDLFLELKERFFQGSDSVSPVVADITHEPEMARLFADHRPDVVFHAAAYKHVPLMEDYPEEAVRVNVLGTRIVAQLAREYGARRFVLVSTDKAINPSSVMGATKRVAELIVQSLGDRGLGSGRGENTGDCDQPGAHRRQPSNGTLYTAVRFGNVLGSRGSVVPTFERQIDQGGPVTVTHPEMTRYFMSIPEAVSLIIQAAAQTTGSDIYMLNMGQRISIDTLARRLIRLRGLRPDVDIPIVYTGVRPGEKMHEELLGSGEAREATAHPNIFRILERADVEPDFIQDRVEQLVSAAEAGNTEAVRAMLSDVAGLTRRSDEGAPDKPLGNLRVVSQPPEAAASRRARPPMPTSP